jgi:hypothetical protein
MLLSIAGLAFALALACVQSVQLRPGIAFFAEHEGGLHLLESSTEAPTRLNVGFVNVGNLAYSTTARLLAFEASNSHEALRSLYILGREDSRPKRVFRSDEKSQLYRPVFDPAGENLYAVNYFTGIHRFPLSDRTWTQVPVLGAPDLNPQGLSFSPSGERVAISPARFDGFLIGRVGPDGFSIEKRILEEFESCISPRWVTETQLVFAGRQASGMQHLWVLDLGSGSVRQLTHPPIAVRDFLSLSPSRTTVVFTATDERKPLEWRLWQVQLDGSDLRQLTRGGDLSSHLSPVYIE